MLVLDITIVNVALPDIGHDFHSSLSDLQWIIDAYALVLAAGIALFTLGSLLCGLATDPVFLVAARIVQGLGGTVVYATSLALISHAFRGEDPKSRRTAFGVYSAVLGIGAALGPVVGGQRQHRRPVAKTAERPLPPRPLIFPASRSHHAGT